MQSVALQNAFAEHRAALLRHCYRMMGSYAEAEDILQEALERAWNAREGYRGEAPIKRWLFTIATNACLNALTRRKRLSLPQLESAPTGRNHSFGEREPERYISPAADARLFPSPEDVSESHETVAMAFVALLQRVPPRQRAALLMKDVLGWPADEIAEALGLSLASVNSAVHRGREAVAREKPAAEEPPEETLRAFVRAWESRDLDALVALLHKDVTLAMPPHAIWFRGIDDVVCFLESPTFATFWSSLGRVEATHANGWPAFAFFLKADGNLAFHSVMVARFLEGRAQEMTVFIGGHNSKGFVLSDP